MENLYLLFKAITKKAGEKSTITYLDDYDDLENAKNEAQELAEDLTEANMKSTRFVIYEAKRMYIGKLNAMTWNEY